MEPIALSVALCILSQRVNRIYLLHFTLLRGSAERVPFRTSSPFRGASPHSVKQLRSLSTSLLVFFSSHLCVSNISLTQRIFRQNARARHTTYACSATGGRCLSPARPVFAVKLYISIHQIFCYVRLPFSF